MAFAICGTETFTIKTCFAMARINVCFNVSFLDFNQYCKKKGNFRNKVYVFSQIIAINIVIVVNSRQAIIVCILVAYTIGDIVLSFHYILYLAESNIYNSNNRCQNKYKLYC